MKEPDSVAALPLFPVGQKPSADMFVYKALVLC